MATITIDDKIIPDGYELTGEYREPRAGEHYLNGAGSLLTAYGGSDYGNTLILAKKRWRAEACQRYYFLDCDCQIIETHDEHTKYDDGFYNAGNYYQTVEDTRQ
jgi:hypothetical protein